MIATLEAKSEQLHEQTIGIQTGRRDWDPSHMLAARATSQDLRRLRDLADICLATLARAGVEPVSDPAAAVVTGPGGDFTRTRCQPVRLELPKPDYTGMQRLTRSMFAAVGTPSTEPLGQRLDVEG